MKNNSMVIGVVIGVIVLLAIMIAISKNEKKNNGEVLLGINYNISGNEAKLDQYKTDNPVVAIYIERYGSVVMELYPDIAPNTVNNFIYLIKNGFYDGNTFHRLMTGFVLQGGDPTGSGMGGPNYSIMGEFSNNGFANDLKHTEGVVSMARSSSSYDSAGSQFFIMLDDDPSLDGNYAAFGKVIDGMDTVKKIEENEQVSDSDTGLLVHNLVLKKAIVDLKGKTYPDPEIVG